MPTLLVLVNLVMKTIKLLHLLTLSLVLVGAGDTDLRL